MLHTGSSRSLRRAYLEWVEEQIEAFKESIPRSDLLRIAEEAIEELRVNQKGQYQLTELLLCDAVDRRIARLLKLPGYRAWFAEQREGAALALAGMGSDTDVSEGHGVTPQNDTLPLPRIALRIAK